MTRTWTKSYANPAKASAAAAHYDWLRDVGQVSVPDLMSRDGHELVFAHVPGRHATPADLPYLASALARFHTAAHQHLAGAPMNEPHQTACGLIIPGFRHRRERRLLDLLATPSPNTPLTSASVRELISHAGSLPTSVYKDANVRNFLINPGREPVMVDFDALTLAPLGYDLAKLIASTVMTYGPLDSGLLGEALDRYNGLLTEAALPGCSNDEFAAWTEMHHILTSPYQGRNGYRHPWTATRR